jgi:long-chain acyl-CoA synthetase
MIPEPGSSGAGLSKLLRTTARRYAGKIALIDRQRTLTYHELDQAANGLARRFRDEGLRPGDRVAIHWNNALEVVQLMLSCFHAGLIAVPINIRLKAPEIVRVLQRCRPRLCFSQPELAAVAEQARQQFPDLPPIRTRLPEPLAGPDLEPPLPDAPALIIFTSGTTAQPKGVTHTHATLAASTRAVQPIGIDDSTVLMAGAPLMHASGSIFLMLPALTAGATEVLLSPFDPPGVLDAVERHRCTLGIVSPVALRFLTEEQRCRPRDVSSMRAWYGGADTVPVALQDQFRETFGLPLAEFYPMTESILISWNRPGAIRKGSIGQVAQGVQVEVRGPDGQALDAGQTGQLAVRSSANFVGYWEDPEATAATLDRGWLLTGDLGRFDADSYLWFEGRCKHLIIRGGSNISPQEVEAALQEHPGVVEAGVVGLPDDVYGERVLACVVLRAGHVVSPSDLREFARERLADYKVPEQVLVLEALPRGLTGKLDHRALKEVVASARNTS